MILRAKLQEGFEEEDNQFEFDRSLISYRMRCTKFDGNKLKLDDASKASPIEYEDFEHKGFVSGGRPESNRRKF